MVASVAPAFDKPAPWQHSFMSRPIQVSPERCVILEPEYLAMLDRPPRVDFVVRTLARRMSDTTPLMSAELVIAGEATRATYPRAQEFPLHFRKTYYPGRLHNDPRIELERQKFASELLGIPAPIGATHNTFRSCLLPGTPLNRLSEFGSEPEESNIAHAAGLDLAAACGLWQLCEQAFQSLTTLHHGGLVHGDAHLHNFMVCPSPLQVIPVDFEQAALQSEMDAAEFSTRAERDLAHILTLAVYIQCALGQQRGALADVAMARLPELVRAEERFRRAIAKRTHSDYS